MIELIEAAKRGEIGDDGFGFDETQEQENYGTYMNYLGLVEDVGFSEEEALLMMNLTVEQVDKFIEMFEPTEEEMAE